MYNRACAVLTKEYPTSGGVLIIENIVKGDRKKTDVIREILENMACPCDNDLVQSASRNTADCGSQVKEAGS